MTIAFPALNEASTIGGSVKAVLPLIEQGLARSVTVIDGGSDDGTDAIARAAGAEVVHADQILNDFGPVLGKGDSVWRYLYQASSGVTILLDADLEGDLMSAAETLIIGAQDAGRASMLVKGLAVRVDETGFPLPFPYGRVTELVALPLLRTILPALGSLASPLSGQMAFDNDTARSMPICTGYGLEIGLLLDWAMRFGAGSIWEIPIGTIRNRANDETKLELVGSHILTAAFMRAADLGLAHPRSFHPSDGVAVRPPAAKLGVTN